jgi:hypothetical protein
LTRQLGAVGGNDVAELLVIVMAATSPAMTEKSVALNTVGGTYRSAPAFNEG